MKVQYKDGLATIDIDGAAQAMVLAMIRETAPIVMRELEAEVERLEANARSKWPSRQKRYGRSKDSKDKFEVGIRLIPPFVQAFVANRAPYAWAIRAGAESDTPVKKGARVADVLLWQPARRGADRLAKRTAQKMMKASKQVK